MKMLPINGSPRANDNTARALKEVADTLAAEGIGAETVWIGNRPVRGGGAFLEEPYRAHEITGALPTPV